MLSLRAYDKSDGRILTAYDPEEQGHREYYPYEIGVGFSHFDKNDLILMFGSGVKDKKGNEIFEGDILQITQKRVSQRGEHEDYTINYKGDVVFEKGAFWVIKTTATKELLASYNVDDWKLEQFEVVGNIYQIGK